jgi:hypothetical protein
MKKFGKECPSPNDEIVGRLCQTPWRFAETPYNYFAASNSGQRTRLALRQQMPVLKIST